MNQQIGLALRMLGVNEFIVKNSLADIAPEDLTRQPDDQVNSMQFLLGHLVIHRAKIGKLAGKEIPLEYSPSFERGVEKKASADYPSVEQLRKDWDAVTAQMKEALAEVSDEHLAKATEGDNPLQDNTILGSIMFLAYHEATHAGQIMYVRKLLGYSGLVG